MTSKLKIPSVGRTHLEVAIHLVAAKVLLASRASQTSSGGLKGAAAVLEAAHSVTFLRSLRRCSVESRMHDEQRLRLRVRTLSSI